MLTISKSDLSIKNLQVGFQSFSPSILMQFSFIWEKILKSPLVKEVKLDKVTVKVKSLQQLSLSHCRYVLNDVENKKRLELNARLIGSIPSAAVFVPIILWHVSFNQSMSVVQSSFGRLVSQFCNLMTLTFRQADRRKVSASCGWTHVCHAE